MWSTAYRFAMVWFGLQRNRKPPLTTFSDKNGNLVTLDTSVNINKMKALLSCTQNGRCTSKRSGWSSLAQQCSTMTRLQLWLGLKMREIIRGVFTTRWQDYKAEVTPLPSLHCIVPATYKSSLRDPRLHTSKKTQNVQWKFELLFSQTHN